MSVCASLKPEDMFRTPGGTQVSTEFWAIGFGGCGTASSKNTGLTVVEHEDDMVVRLRNPSNQVVADLLLNPWDVCIERVLGKETGAEGEAEEEEYEDDAWTAHHINEKHQLVAGCTFESMLKTSGGFHRVLYIKGDEVVTHGSATNFDFESEEAGAKEGVQRFNIPDVLAKIGNKKFHIVASPTTTASKASDWLSKKLVPVVCPLDHVATWLPEMCQNLNFDQDSMVISAHRKEELTEALRGYTEAGYPAEMELVKVSMRDPQNKPQGTRFFPCSALNLIGFRDVQ